MIGLILNTLNPVDNIQKKKEKKTNKQTNKLDFNVIIVIN